ncbi:MAG: hypothetical protein SGILL_007028 [Bacillariaceae sp.]
MDDSLNSTGGVESVQASEDKMDTEETPQQQPHETINVGETLLALSAASGHDDDAGMSASMNTEMDKPSDTAVDVMEQDKDDHSSKAPEDDDDSKDTGDDEKSASSAAGARDEDESKALGEEQSAAGDEEKSGSNAAAPEDDDESKAAEEDDSKAPDEDESKADEDKSMALDNDEQSTALDDAEQSGMDDDEDASKNDAGEEDLGDSDDDEEEEDTEAKQREVADGDDSDDDQSGSGGQADGDDEESEESEEESVAETTKKAALPRKKRERYHVPKIFQDAITVLIPLDVTADLRVAVKHTREKRIKSIYKHFPVLEKEITKKGDKSESDAMTGDDDDEKAKDESKRPTKKKKLEHVPQPEQFGSVLDYLEAKYVKGVMLDEDEDEGPNLDDRSEGNGSVYSKDSFLDDTDLQRDVAEQVMASTTTTKLELEHEDGDFFVNVGNLEIDNDDYGENYDPLQDKDSSKPKKKRKKPTLTSATGATIGTPAKKKKKTPAKEQAPGSAKSSKSKKSTASAKTTKTTTSAKTTKTTASTKTTKTTATKKSTAAPKSEKEIAEKAEKRRAVKRLKGRLDTLHRRGIAMIKELTDEELPKRKTKLKVALTCPQKKKPGDEVTFSNPHNPGQKLKVKVPKDCAPGGSFKVSVPVKYSQEDEEKDHNKFSREFKDFLDDYAKGYDEWIQARHDVNPDVNAWKEKQNKFEKLATEFPKNLMTKVDNAYLKIILRKGRQSKYKRKPKAETEAKVKVEKAEETAEEEEKPQTRTIDIPGMGKQFEKIEWKESDFA